MIWVMDSGGRYMLENLAEFGSEHGYGDIKTISEGWETSEDESRLSKGML